MILTLMIVCLILASMVQHVEMKLADLNVYAKKDGLDQDVNMMLELVKTGRVRMMQIASISSKISSVCK